jgi:hypothetical protein
MDVLIMIKEIIRLSHSKLILKAYGRMKIIIQCVRNGISVIILTVYYSLNMMDYLRRLMENLQLQDA